MARAGGERRIGRGRGPAGVYVGALGLINAVFLPFRFLARLGFGGVPRRRCAPQRGTDAPFPRCRRRRCSTVSPLALSPSPRAPLPAPRHPHSHAERRTVDQPSERGAHLVSGCADQIYSSRDFYLIPTAVAGLEEGGGGSGTSPALAARPGVLSRGNSPGVSIPPGLSCRVCVRTCKDARSNRRRGADAPYVNVARTGYSRTGFRFSRARRSSSSRWIIPLDVRVTTELRRKRIARGRTERSL